MVEQGVAGDDSVGGADKKDEKPQKWEPGRLQWYVTAAIALIGAVTGVVSLFMNFFYHKPEPPVTISSSVEAFATLSYSEQIDRCVPYVKANLESWYNDWMNGLKSSSPPGTSFPDGFLPIDANPTTYPPQEMMNTLSAVENYATDKADRNVGLNLLSCLWGASWTSGDPQDLRKELSGTVGAGISTSEAQRLVRACSPFFYNRIFDDFDPRTRKSVVCQTVLQLYNPDDPANNKEVEFTYVAGHTPGVGMWTLPIAIDKNDENWVDDLSTLTD